MVNRLQSNQAESGTTILHSLELASVLKRELDLIYKQLNYFRGVCKSVDRLNRATKLYSDYNQSSDGPTRLLAEFVKFEKNYRIWRKRFRKLDREMTNVDLYDKFYDLYESLKANQCKSRVENCTNIVGHDSNDSYANDIIEIKLDNSELRTSNLVDGDTVVRDPEQQQRTTSTKNQATQTKNFVDSKQTKAKSLTKNKIKLKKTKPVLKPSTATKTSTKSKTKAPKRNSVECSDTELSTDSELSDTKKTKTKKVKTSKLKAAKIFICEVEGCQYTTTVSSSMINHKVVHSDDRPFRCDKCEATFKMKGPLKTHQNSVHEGKRFECREEGCRVSYTSMKQLRQHVQIVHTKEAPLLHCPRDGCDYRTYNGDCLKTHRLVHMSGHRQFKCTFEGCDFSTYRADSLKSHRVVHCGDRPYKCPQCERAFKSVQSLCHHRRMHNRERRFKCSWQGCDFSTHHSRDLKSHQVVHTGDRPFKCIWPGCGQAFKSPSGFWGHKLSHENQRRYKCSFEGCDYAANHCTHLKRHQESIHGKHNKKLPKKTQQHTNQNHLSDSNHSN